MTHEALIAEARKVVQSIGRDGVDGITLDMVPKVRAVDAVVVYFTSDEHEGKIEVILESESGKFIAGGGGSMAPNAKKTT
jgi:hypothetical protein